MLRSTAFSLGSVFSIASPKKPFGNTEPFEEVLKRRDHSAVITLPVPRSLHPLHLINSKLAFVFKEILYQAQN